MYKCDMYNTGIVHRLILTEINWFINNPDEISKYKPLKLIDSSLPCPVKNYGNKIKKKDDNFNSY